jgi:hypothetical protein
VESVEADACGGVTIHLSGGYRLRLFPDGSVGEDWRFFVLGDESAHFVIAGARLEED